MAMQASIKSIGRSTLTRTMYALVSGLIFCAGSSTGTQSRQRTVRSARMATAAQPKAEAREPGPRDAASIA